MNGTKVMWAQLGLVFGLTLAGLWTATEWTAWRLHFQPQLGRPWFELAGWPIYPGIATTSTSWPIPHRRRAAWISSLRVRCP